MSDPRDVRSNMLALLSLLDVLAGKAKMTGIGVDRVGRMGGTGGRIGEVRIRFTVFGDEDRLMQLATELTELQTEGEIVRKLEGAVDPDAAIGYAQGMIENWREVIDRLIKLRTLKLEGDTPTREMRIPKLSSMGRPIRPIKELK